MDIQRGLRRQATCAPTRPRRPRPGNLHTSFSPWPQAPVTSPLHQILHYLCMTMQRSIMQAPAASEQQAHTPVTKHVYSVVTCLPHLTRNPALTLEECCTASLLCGSQAALVIIQMHLRINVEGWCAQHNSRVALPVHCKQV